MHKTQNSPSIFKAPVIVRASMDPIPLHTQPVPKSFPVLSPVKNDGRECGSQYLLTKQPSHSPYHHHHTSFSITGQPITSYRHNRTQRRAVVDRSLISASVVYLSAVLVLSARLLNGPLIWPLTRGFPGK